ncbi:hypothetical protein F511_19277 [Dorcoceras hygrometricum]|uniref:Uncharacterized protein n=1 Tax=Dorcoceras hygrometricum TaxID=472368 RepID=A0A2Z7A6Z4_9LAMI|nr:hypothetical protein F511_19277 [Dorcoceras hygrometricum]
MSSPDERIIGEVAQSLDFVSTSGGEQTGSADLKTSYIRKLARIFSDEARLTKEERLWYEIKVSFLNKSDITMIRERSGMSDNYDILIPDVGDRAHIPPDDTIPFTLITKRWVLALRVVLRIIRETLSLQLLHKLTQVWLEDFGKFYICLKPELGFIKGNPSSHKGWMSRYFFLRPCEYDPTNFLNTMSVKCFNAQELIREDLLCHFGFSGHGIEVEEDLVLGVGGKNCPVGSRRPEKRLSPLEDLWKMFYLNVEEVRGAIPSVKLEATCFQFHAFEASVVQPKEEVQKVKEEVMGDE